MNLREQFEKEIDEIAVFNSFSGNTPNMSYVEWLEQRNKEQVEVLREWYEVNKSKNLSKRGYDRLKITEQALSKAGQQLKKTEL